DNPQTKTATNVNRQQHLTKTQKHKKTHAPPIQKKNLEYGETKQDSKKTRKAAKIYHTTLTTGFRKSHTRSHTYINDL
ncbi:hypothetical protein, partial [Acinetobacter baumannii]